MAFGSPGMSRCSESSRRAWTVPAPAHLPGLAPPPRAGLAARQGPDDRWGQCAVLPVGHLRRRSLIIVLAGIVLYAFINGRRHGGSRTAVTSTANVTTPASKEEATS